MTRNSVFEGFFERKVIDFQFRKFDIAMFITMPWRCDKSSLNQDLYIAGHN
jgi:hypothetical protein